MSHILSSAPLLALLRPLHTRNSPKISLVGSRGALIPAHARAVPALRCSNPDEGHRSTSDEEESLEREELSILRPWDVPWDWKTTAYVMMPYLMSIAFAGILRSTGLAGAPQLYSESTISQLHNTDELAMKMFLDQAMKSLVKLSILYVFVSQHQPFPDDIFSFRLEQPFNHHDGWILWAGGGLLVASSVVLLTKFFFSPTTNVAPNEAEALVRMLPLIGSSNISTVCLVGVSGFLAPICEETIYRGFLLPSLAKWFPLPVSVILSSAVFAFAHQSPGKALDIFIFGVVLGLVYARTRNLLAPITMHAFWNIGVILSLTFLRSQGYEIQKFVI